MQESKPLVELAPPEELPTDWRRPLRAGFLVLIFGFGTFMAWAAYAPLESGVLSTGTVIVDGRRKTVQHLSGGIIKQILIKEGQPTKEGDILIRLDDATALAAKSSADSQLKAVDIQIGYLEKLLLDLTPIVSENFYPRNRYIDLQKQLADAKAQRVALLDKLAAAKLDLQRLVVLAPVSGIVMGLSVTTEGGVISAGSRILEIVPADEKLVVEAQIQPHLIDRVAPGLIAEVRFSTTKARKTPVIKGKVEWISADRFPNAQDASAATGFYIAHVIIPPSEIEKLPDLQIRPGMIADVIINTGERTFLNYLLKPISDSIAVSIKEH